MKTATDLRGCGPFADSTPAEVRAALIDDDVPAFDRQWRQALAEAADSYDLSGLNVMLDAWRRLAWVQQDREKYAHMMDVAGRLTRGEDVRTTSWEQHRAELGL